LIPHSRDLVAASDFLNYTRYQPVLSSFRINQGSEDKLVALWKFDASTILCFKESSVYAVRNIYGNMADIFLDEISRGYGLKSAKAVVSVGRDVWFLSDQRGVVSLSLSESGKMQGLDVPISEPIQSVIDRINWPYAHNAAAAWHNNKYYLAVPLDGSTTNNKILVYDFRNQAWSGYDESGEIDGLTDFVTFKYQGAKRLFFMADGLLNLYDDPHISGFVDEAVDTTNTSTRNISHTQISDEVTTRGYKCGSEDFKRFQQSNVTVSTNGVVGGSGGIDVVALLDGVEETKSLVTDKRFSRTKYHQPFDKADYVETNAGDDYMTAYREDYSTDFSTAITLDNVNTSGFDPDAHQSSTQKVRFNKGGRFMQLKISNNLGRAKVVGTAVTALPGKTMITERR